jgi:hypothetical protein
MFGKIPKSEQTIDLGKRMRTPPQRKASPSPSKKKGDKDELPAGWVAPEFFTAMTIGAGILIEEASPRIIMPSAKDITDAFPRIGAQIIRRFNMARERQSLLYQDLCR